MVSRRLTLPFERRGVGLDAAVAIAFLLGVVLLALLLIIVAAMGRSVTRYEFVKGSALEFVSNEKTVRIEVISDGQKDVPQKNSEKKVDPIATAGQQDTSDGSSRRVLGSALLITPLGA